jgi:uncharacterized membrane protein YoaK (UPF0700 family)
MTRYDRRSIALAVALSGLAGYVDAIGFLSAGRFFVSFMSGNSTRLGIAAGEGRFGYALVACGTVFLFVLGVIAGTLSSRWAGPRRKPVVLLLIALLLTLAAAARTLGQPHLGTALLLLAMGAENAVFQRRGEVSIGLTYMTGTLVRLGQRLADALRGGPRWAWIPYVLLWLGLVCGAALGATGYDHLSTFALWPAAIYALGLATLTTRLRPRFR